MKQINNFVKIKFMTLGFTNIFPKREIFRILSEKFNGSFEVYTTKGQEIERHKLIIPFDKYELILSQSDTKPLKFEINFDSKQDFNLLISKEGTVEKVIKFFGKKEVEIGHQKFDNQYLIESNDASITTNLIAKEIADQILQNNIYSISYSTDVKNLKSQLTTVVSMTEDDMQKIEVLINLHFNIIRKLKEVKVIQ